MQILLTVLTFINFILLEKSVILFVTGCILILGREIQMKVHDMYFQGYVQSFVRHYKFNNQIHVPFDGFLKKLCRTTKHRRILHDHSVSVVQSTQSVLLLKGFGAGNWATFWIHQN